MANTGSQPASPLVKWIVLGMLILGLVGLLVWAGTQSQVATAKVSTTQATGAAPDGAVYLEQHKGKPGVKTTASGLQFEVLAQGTGPMPAATDMVTVHYEGKLLDGTVFDSSYQRGQPASFGLNQVIPGWTEGVQLMHTGSKYRFTIPPALGYGEQGAGGAIPPNAVLIFDIELLGVQPR